MWELEPSLTWARLITDIFHALSGGKDYMDLGDGRVAFLDREMGDIYVWTKP